MKTRTLLIVVVVCFSLLTMLVFSIFMSNQIGKTAEEQFNSMVTEITYNQSRNAEQLIEFYGRTLSFIAGDAVLREYLGEYEQSEKSAEDGVQSKEKEEELLELYEKTLNSLQSYIHEETSTAQLADMNVFAVAVFDDDKKMIVSTSDVFKDIFERTWFSEAENDKLYACTGLDSSNASDYKLMRMTKIGNYNIAVVFDAANLKTIFSHSTFPINGRIVLFDPNKQLLDSVFYVGNLAEIKMPEFNRFKERIIQNNFTTGTESFTYEIGKNKRIAYITNVADTGWLLGTIGESEKAFTHSNVVNAVLINCLIFLGLFVMAIGIVVMVYFTKPLKIIEETLVRIRKGDHEARISINQNNEYGDIEKVFNDLLDDVIVSEGRYRTIIEMSDNIIFEWNLQNNHVYFSKNFNKKFSYRAPSDTFEDSFLLKCKVHPEDTEAYRQDLDRLALGENLQRNEYRWKNIYGDYIWILLRTATIRNMDNEIVKVVGVIVDIDRAKKSEMMLTLRASYDALTGFYNRETIESLINNEIDLVDVRKNEFAILFIDVDDFKQYNDNYSHATGDQVLEFTAASIREIVEQFGIGGRYGGDEFVVCIRNSEINDPAKVSQQILDRLKEGFVCDMGDHLTVAVSIGIAIIRNSSLRVDEIIGMADDAMYRIKKSGKSNYGFIVQE